MSLKSSSKMSSSKAGSQYSSASAKKRVSELERVLNDEKQKRLDVEKEIQKLKKDLLEIKKQ